LTAHPGKNPVIIRLPQNGQGYKEMRIKNHLDGSPVVLRKLKEIVGEENVSWPRIKCRPRFSVF